jgi:2-dehydro-3-deoxy-L-rhamnonate dehydrogenase (NAD+)
MSVRDAFNLEGRTALVTGGSRGLGLAMAGALGEMGAKVVISARKADELDAAVASLQKDRGVTAVRVVGDLSRPENVNPFVDAVAAAAGAPIDILVNNAGATWGAPAEEHPLDGWNKVIGLNLTGMFLLTQQVGARWMIPRKQGRIVNIASVAGKDGNPNASAYSASKAGVIALTKSLGKELADTNVRVNCVTPAAVKTAIFDQMTQEHIAFMLSKIPMGRFGTVEEVAAMVAWLCTEDCAFSTGAVFDLSGGRSTY